MYIIHCLLYTVYCIYIYCSILFTAHNKEKLEVLAMFTGLSSVCCLQNTILLLKFYKCQTLSLIVAHTLHKNCFSAGKEPGI